jgi:beta-galactosidase/evolved beta-galactosidase subunit alpha
MRIRKNEFFPTDISIPVSLPDELCNPNVLQMNRLAPRSTIIPASKKSVYYYNKEQSDRLFSLNGDWNFALFKKSAPENFECEDFNDADWDLIDVPSMWQFRGYAECTYPNVRYPFQFMPPHVLKVNPVGCYRRKFTLSDDNAGKRAILHFEGVDNAFYVYINGEFVGFSKGSRLPAEFDVTNLLRKGENLISVKVYTYSDSSYLENQDMLMANGIFRDVYIIFTPKTALWDWEIITNTEKLTLTATLFEGGENATARITFNGESVVIPFKNNKLDCEVARGNLPLWSAEEPNLFDLTLEVLVDNNVTEIHSKRVGFVFSEIVGREFRVNGKKTILRGICRHENNAKNGRSLTVEQVRADLELIKSHNINAIRCAHYPNNPAFYEFASELGIYVMDEGDLESHGCSATGDQGYLSKEKDWLPAYMDRTVRTAERDKNETCIVIWSVGNEIGTGSNVVKCADYYRGRKDKKPVQYHAPDRGTQDFSVVGYPSLYKLEFHRQQPENANLPICLIEYAHAMGNSPGNLKNLWDFVINHDEYMGGFVWEFRSHGMERVNPDGSIDYLYGGDFHDTNHWTNFTLDGYCRSDGTPKPTFGELKWVYAPIRMDLTNKKLTFHNIQSFASTNGLSLVTEIFCDGKLYSKNVQPMPFVAPFSKVQMDFDPEYIGHDCFVNFSVLKGDEKIAFMQFELESKAEKAKLTPAPFDCEYSVNQDQVAVEGKDFKVSFANGLPNFYEKKGKVYFNQPAEIVTHRAETDNDGIVGVFSRWIGEWERTRLHKMRIYTMKTDVEKQDESLAIKVDAVLTYDCNYTGFNLNINYNVFADGLVTTNMIVKPFGEMPCIVYDTKDNIDPLTPRLPRFGVVFKLGKDLNTVKWFGRGSDQNYDDTIGNAPVGVYELPIEKMNFEFDVPQETGNRGDTRYAQIKNGNQSFTVYGNECFQFSYHPWKLNDLRNARHKSELKEDNENNYLYIDYKMRALGSHSCGPNPEKELDFEPHDFQFVFAFNGEEVAEPQYFLKDFGEKTKKLTDVYVYTRLTAEREEVECDTRA